MLSFVAGAIALLLFLWAVQAGRNTRQRECFEFVGLPVELLFRPAGRCLSRCAGCNLRKRNLEVSLATEGQSDRREKGDCANSVGKVLNAAEAMAF